MAPKAFSSGLKKVGALWDKEGKNGKFMSGVINCPHCGEESSLLLFANRFKSKEREPDVTINVREEDSKPKKAMGTMGTPIEEDVPF